MVAPITTSWCMITLQNTSISKMKKERITFHVVARLKTFCFHKSSIESVSLHVTSSAMLLIVVQAQRHSKLTKYTKKCSVHILHKSHYTNMMSSHSCSFACQQQDNMASLSFFANGHSQDLRFCSVRLLTADIKCFIYHQVYF